MALTLGEAAKAVGKSKPTVLKLINDGKLAAVRGEDGRTWQIEPAELFRVYPKPKLEPEPVAAPRAGQADAVRLAVAEAENVLLRDSIQDFKERLEKAEAARDAAQEKVTGLLESHKPAKRWWNR